MKINRQTQLNLLTRLSDNYPKICDVRRWSTEFDFCNENLSYLHEHGLCNARIENDIPSKGPTVYSAKITAKGLDFLADDGGLSAILGVVTIKLHDETIKDLIESKILQSDLPEPDKKRFLDRLRELPAETTKHLVMKLVDLGIDKAPTAIDTIGKFLTGP